MIFKQMIPFRNRPGFIGIRPNLINPKPSGMNSTLEKDSEQLLTTRGSEVIGDKEE